MDDLEGEGEGSERAGMTPVLEKGSQPILRRASFDSMADLDTSKARKRKALIEWILSLKAKLQFHLFYLPIHSNMGV